MNAVPFGILHFVSILARLGFTPSAVAVLLLACTAEAPTAVAQSGQASAPERLEIGKRVPGFWVHSASGQIIHIHDESLRKKWVLLEFWTSKAGDRLRGQTRMEALRKVFLRQDRLAMFSVCVDLDFEQWLEYIEAQEDLLRANGDKVKFHSDERWWQLVLGTSKESQHTEVIAKYGLVTMPRYFLITPNATLASDNIDEGDLEEVLMKHLGRD